MPQPWQNRRPLLSLPFTVLAGADLVRLVAGEDHRYTFTAPGIDQWLPGLLAGCTGGDTIESLLAGVAADGRPLAIEVLQRLFDERILCDGPAEQACSASPAVWSLAGQGRLHEMLSYCFGTAGSVFAPSPPGFAGGEGS